MPSECKKNTLAPNETMQKAQTKARKDCTFQPNFGVGNTDSACSSKILGHEYLYTSKSDYLVNMMMIYVLFWAKRQQSEQIVRP